MHYESSVALGTFSVFYTQSFTNTIPVVYQLFNVFPFIVGPLLTILLIPTMLFFLFLAYKQKNINFLILLVFFGAIFSSQMIFFVKWTRYMVPVIAVYLCMVSLVFVFLLKDAKKFIEKYSILFLGLMILIYSIASSFSYVYTVFFAADNRIMASNWATNHISPENIVLTEPYDIGSFAFHLPKMTTIDFYNIEQNTDEQNKLFASLSQANYILIPSQRLMKTRLLEPKQFPFGSRYYQKLFSGTLGFQIVYQTSCNIFCDIAYGTTSPLLLEETTSVFDRPTMFIFRKNKQFTPTYYQEVLK
jgi:hypothetical protein